MTVMDPIRVLPKDRGWAWMCLIGGLLMNTITAGGIFKSFGVIFSHVEAKYDVSAAFLSWVPSSSVGLALIMSPLSNALASRFTTRWVVIAGSLFAMTGFVLSSIAERFSVFFFTYSICIGVGTGLLYTPSIVVVGQHFEKKRGLANGLSLAGSGIGSITIPPIMVYALNTYGIEGTLLIMGGMALNICVSGMLFRPAKFYMRRYCLTMERHRMLCTAVLHAGTKQPSGVVNTDEIGDIATAGCVKPIAVEESCLGEYVINTHQCPQSAESLDKKSSQPKETDYEANGDGSGTKHERQPNHVVLTPLLGGGCHPDKDAKVHKQNYTSEQLRSSAITVNPPTKDDTFGGSVIDIECHSSNDVSLTTDLNGTSCRSEDQPYIKPSAFEYRLLTNPILLIYCATVAIACSVYFTMFIMTTPNAEQLGFTYTKAALLVSIMGGADMVSRVGFGLLSDSKIVKTQHMFHASLALGTVVLFVLPSLKTYPAIASASVLFAIAGGGYISLLPTLLAEAIGIQHLPTSLGVTTMTIGCANLTVPPLMGKLRDMAGTWGVSFYACGALMAAVTFLNLLVPLATKTQQRRLKKKSCRE